MLIKKIAGVPGAGKTRTMLEYFEQELKEIRPDRVAFLTFTRAAKLEALGRTGKTQEDLPYLRTIHSICYRELHLGRDQIVQGKDIRSFGKLVGVKLGVVAIDPYAQEEFEEGQAVVSPGDVLLQINHLGRHCQIGLKTALRDFKPDVDFYYAKWFTENYRRWKEQESLKDYTDILTSYLDHGNPLPIDVLFVDEAQDLSLLQWKVVEKLGANAQRWYVAGDDDQAIFVWAGASPDYFISMKSDENQFLEKSYRVPKVVANYANNLSKRIKTRMSKNIEPVSEEGTIEQYFDLVPRMFSGSPDTFVLVRNHWRGRILAKVMEEADVPFGGSHAVLSQPDIRNCLAARYRITHGQDMTVFETRALISKLEKDWLRPGVQQYKDKRLSASEIMIRIPKNDEEWNRALRIPNKRYISAVINKYGWSRAMRPPIQVLSIHQAKGREATRVILDCTMAGKTFNGFSQNVDDLGYHQARDNELRCWYVGITRTKRDLYILGEQELASHGIHGII